MLFFFEPYDLIDWGLAKTLIYMYNTHHGKIHTGRTRNREGYWKGVEVGCARYVQSPKQEITEEEWVFDCLRMMLFVATGEELSINALQ